MKTVLDKAIFGYNTQQKAYSMLGSSLVPRLLPSFLSHTVQKRGESLEDLMTCTMCTMCGFMRGFGNQIIAHTFINHCHSETC